MRTMLAALTVCMISLPVDAQSLSDDLCNFSIEGLTLQSTKSDVVAAFGGRGWHNFSTPPATLRSGTVEEIIFDKEPAPTSKNPHVTYSANRFVMKLRNGILEGMTLYGDTPPGGGERARAFCELFDDRFEVSGCSADQLRGRAPSIHAKPKNPVNNVFCQAGFTVMPRGPYPGAWSMGVSRHNDDGFYSYQKRKQDSVRELLKK